MKIDLTGIKLGGVRLHFSINFSIEYSIKAIIC